MDTISTVGSPLFPTQLQAPDGSCTWESADDDLKQRGSGEVLGTPQSGLPDLKFGAFIGDAALDEQAKAMAETMILKPTQEG